MAPRRKTNDNNCSICLELLHYSQEDGDGIGACVPCGHVFHCGCFRAWIFHDSSRCPNCSVEVSKFLKLYVDLEPPPVVHSKATSTSTSEKTIGSDGDLFLGPPTKEEGCFVYEAQQSIGIRFAPTDSDEYKTGKLAVDTNELVHIDCILRKPPYEVKNPADEVESGPFLRLADGSGWLFETKRGRSDVMMRKLHVSQGLWIFYADNFPAGIALRKHPNDSGSNHVKPDRTFLPLQKIICDRHVKNAKGVNFYRVQGTNGWVFDKRGDLYMLIPESTVRFGHFVYKARFPLAVRNKTYVVDESRTPFVIGKDELVSVDAVRESPWGPSNGPFLRCSDFSGWLFVSKQGEIMMDSVPVEEGQFILRVGNAPHGIDLRRHPIDRNDVKFYPMMHYHPEETIVCDFRVTAGNVSFYRVKGTPGWVFDRRGSLKMLTLLDEESVHPQRNEKQRRLDKLQADEDALRQSLISLEDNIAHGNGKRQGVLQRLAKREHEREKAAKIRKQRESQMTRLVQEEEKKRLEEERKRSEKKKELLEELERKKRGDNFAISMFLADEISFDGSDQLVAMGGRATLRLTSGFGWAFTSSLATDVHKKLHTRAPSHPRPTYVALGSFDRFYIKFANGKVQWSNEETQAFDDIVRNHSVRCVAFGRNLSYVIVTDSSHFWDNVPAALERVLQGRRPIHSVSMGPDGEYFVAFKDGSFKGGGWSNAVNNWMGQLKRNGWHVRDVKFGENGSYIIRYSSYSGSF